MGLLRRAYQCDPIPWTILYALLVLLLNSHLFLFSDPCPENSVTLGALEFDTNGLLAKITSLAIVILSPIWFRNLIRETAILDFKERVSLYPMALLMSTSLLSCQALFWSVLFIMMMLLFGVLVKLKEGDSLSSASFKAGLIVAVCSFFSPFFLLLLGLVWPGFSILRTLNWRSIIWTFIGLFLPYYFYSTVQYLVTSTFIIFPFDDKILKEPIDTISTGGLLSGAYILMIIMLMVLLVIRTIRSSRKGIVKRRNFLRVGLIFLGISSALSLILFQFTGAFPFLGLMTIPMSILYLELLKDGSPKIDVFLTFLWLAVTILFVWK